MVEVFKTNVMHREEADFLVSLIHKLFPGCKSNFDLQDCDRILRVSTPDEFVDTISVIHLLEDYGYVAEILKADILLPKYNLH
jgi:hypothetical protein